MRFFLRYRICSIFLFILVGKAGAAPDGNQLYTLYCSACHGVDGKGAEGASFPPLTKSDWVKGDARRMISVVLHGLAEPIVVNKKTYNLQMPPQGAQLDDAKIAAISTYVRQNFGNKESAVDTDLVRAVREATKNRTAMWTAPELLMKYPLTPLPLHKLGVRNLTTLVYEGEFETMPDFSQLQPISEEKEKGPISLTHAGGRTENFAIVWEGIIDCPGTWDGNFFVSSVGGMRLFYNEQFVFELKGLGEHYRHTTARTGGTKKGANTFRLEYFQKGPKGGLALYRSGGSMGYHPLTDTFRDPKTTAFPDIMIGPEEGKAAIYRNTIKDVSPRAISIGLPGGVNYAFSASTASLELLWEGKFINAGQHWTHRGSGQISPAGENTVSLGRGPGVMHLSDPKTWPNEDMSIRFQGYDLDDKNRPTFRYKHSDYAIEDTLAEGPRSLRRTISITIPDGWNPKDLAFRLASDQKIAKHHNGFLVNDILQLQVSDLQRVKHRDKLLYLDLSGLESGTYQFQITYQWIK